jgi:serine/threonine-protein kinase HipA
VASPLPVAQAVRGFARDDVTHRDSTFLEYAYEQGAAIGGATGAGGEAPKLLMAEDRAGLLYPDATLPDDRAHAHWLVKFARNKGSQTDQDILRSEYHYYRALQQLGVDTVPVTGLALEEARKPRLWMRRFDRAVTQDAAGQLRVQRLAMESVYSLCSVTIPGHAMQHTEVLQALARLWRDVGQAAQIPAMVSDYLRRDLLNKILGNSDNHGRNTSIIRGDTSVRLAPIYDLAPMVMDQSLTTWGLL